MSRIAAGPDAKIEALGCDAAGREEIADAPADGGRGESGRLEDQARAGYPLQHPGPERQHRFVDLGELVEAAEGRRSVGSDGDDGGREVGDRLEQEPDRQPDEGLGEEARLCRRQQDLVGDRVVHRAEAAGAHLHHRHLDRRRLHGEDAGAGAGQVRGDVDQDVDAVLPHQAHDVPIGESLGVMESSRRRAVALGHVVGHRGRQVRIEVELDLLRVMRFDGRQQVGRMRAAVEHAVVDITHLQPPPGIGGVRVRSGEAGERIGEAPVHASAIGKLRLRRQLRIEMKEGEEVPVDLGVARIECDDGAPGADGVADAALVEEGERQRQMRIRCSRRDPERAAGGDDRRFARLRGLGQDGGECVPGLGRARQEGERAVKRGKSAGVVSGRGQGHAERAMSLAAAGCDPYQPDEKAGGVCRAPETGKQIAIGAEPALVLGDGEEPLVPGDRRLGPVDGGESGAIEKRGREARIEGERAAEPGRRLSMSSRTRHQRAQPVLGLGRCRVEGERAGQQAGMAHLVAAGEAGGVVKVETGRGGKGQGPAQLGGGGGGIGAVERQRQQMTQVGSVRMPGEQLQIDGDRHLGPAGTMGGERIGERIGGGHRAEALYRPAFGVEA